MTRRAPMPRSWPVAALAAAWLALGLLAGAALAAPDEDPALEPQRPGADTGEEQEAPQMATYEVVFNVPTEEGLKAAVEANSRLVSLQAQPPATLAALRRRTQDDAARFDDVMQSFGYYDPDITTSVEGTAAPYTVTVVIAPGERYTLATYDIAYVGGPPDAPDAVATLDDIGIVLGAPAVADNVVRGEARLVRWLRDHGYPFARVDDRLALVDNADKTLWVQVAVVTGPLVRYGELDITGLERSNRELVTRFVSWQQGDIYQQSAIDDFLDRLQDTGVFERVLVAPAGDADDPAGERTIDVSLEEGPPRSVRVGAAYDTGQGPEGRLGWEHRNLFGGGETLSLRTIFGFERQRFDASLRKPDFLQLDQDLIISSSLINEQTDAYDRTGIENAAIVERPLTENLIGTAGVAAEYFRISDDIGPERSMLFGLPVTLEFDNTDNLLNPTEGFRLGVGVTPWAGNADTAIQFLQGDIHGSAYYAVDSGKRIVLAVRGELGSICGANLAQIPANRRFYAGGGGSIRGYEYQKAGPLNDKNDPTGGASLLTTGFETRLMVTEEIGIVPFIEGGTVFPETRPDFNERFFWGAGLGLRYLTPVGPIRFDVAIPLDKRPNIDDPYQFYISIGQAF